MKYTDYINNEEHRKLAEAFLDAGGKVGRYDMALVYLITDEGQYKRAQMLAAYGSSSDYSREHYGLPRTFGWYKGPGWYKAETHSVYPHEDKSNVDICLKLFIPVVPVVYD